jgi:polar amino acid transport system substrate-binding protein
MLRTICAAMIIAAGTAAAAAQGTPQRTPQGMPIVSLDVTKELAPTGKLRVGINLGNAVLAQKDAASGELKGVTVDLARELGRRTGLPVELTEFQAAGKTFEAMNAGQIDVAFFANEPQRAAEVDFTPAYVHIEGTYMVWQDSPLKKVEDVDRPGVRIASGRASAYTLYLKRNIKQATLVEASAGGGRAMIELFLNDRLEAAAGVKQQLQAYAKNDPSVRVMDGHFMIVRQAMGLPKGRPKAQAYLHGFIEEMKRSGFVAEGLKRSNQPDAAVAPPAS